MSQTGGDGARTDSFGYDDAGNMTTRTVGDTTQTLQWDAEGNLAGAREYDSATGLCRDVNPIMGPISCHAPGNDGKPHGIGGEPNPGGHVYEGSPSRYNSSRYHYSYNPQLKSTGRARR